jgi:hypothetical protein
VRESVTHPLRKYGEVVPSTGMVAALAVAGKRVTAKTAASAVRTMRFMVVLLCAGGGGLSHRACPHRGVIGEGKWRCLDQ